MTTEQPTPKDANMRKRILDAHESLLTVRAKIITDQATVSAAKDSGDKRGDKDRKNQVKALLAAATKLRAECPRVPDVVMACDGVSTMATFLDKLEAATVQLARAGENTPKAIESIKAAAEYRNQLDAALPGVTATLSVLTRVGAEQQAMLGEVEALESALADLHERIAKKSAQVAGASKAVLNSMLMG